MGNGKVSHRCRTPHRNRCTRCQGLQWPTKDALSGTVLFPSYRDVCTCHSLDTADVDAVVFTSGASATTVRQNCPARSTHCDDRLVSADADIVINSSVGRWLLLVLQNIVSPLHLPLLSHGSYRLLGVWFCLRNSIPRWVSFRLARRVGAAVRAPSLRVRSAMLTSASSKASSPVDSKTRHLAGDMTLSVSVVVRVRSSDVDCPSHNNLYRLVALMVCSSTALLCFGGALNMGATELDVNMAPCPHSQVSKSRGDWMQSCSDTGGDTDPSAIRLL